MNRKEIIDFLKNKKVQWGITLVLLLVILIWSSSIRSSNIPILNDVTTGGSALADLDAYYFLRLGEILLEKGHYPAVDTMRYIPLQVGFANEVLPYVLVFLYKIISPFKAVSLAYVSVIYPVIFFFLSMILFFFLIFYLTKSKLTALLSSAFLAFIPSYLFRTMAGVSDHEPLGIFAFFLALLTYAISLKFLEKEKIKKYTPIVLGFFSSIGTLLTILGWTGISNFVFMIFPLSFGIIWLLKIQKLENKKELRKYLMFYISWTLFSILLPILFNFSLSMVLGIVFLNSTSMVNSLLFLFLIIDYFLLINENKLKNLKKYHILIGIILAIFSALLLGILSGLDVYGVISDFAGRLINPYGSERISLTVAENAQPYLSDWVSQIGKIAIFLFILGMVFVGISMSKKLKERKEKVIFVILWTLVVSGILFSRISSSSILNGNNFLSKLFYFSGILLFLIYSIYLYKKQELKIEVNLLIISSWLILMLIAGRGAIRLFFVVTPMVAFMMGYGLNSLIRISIKSRDELIKILFISFAIISIILAGVSLKSFVTQSTTQAKYIGPSANVLGKK